MMERSKLALGFLVLGLLIGGAYAAVAQNATNPGLPSPPGLPVPAGPPQTGCAADGDAETSDDDGAPESESADDGNEAGGAEDGPDQGPDANPDEPGHQDADGKAEQEGTEDNC